MNVRKRARSDESEKLEADIPTSGSNDLLIKLPGSPKAEELTVMGSAAAIRFLAKAGEWQTYRSRPLPATMQTFAV